MNFLEKTTLFCGIFLVSGCRSKSLFCRLERIIPESAIYEILETPKPKNWPENGIPLSEGERLVVSWRLPRGSVSLLLQGDLLFGKGLREIVEAHPVKPCGFWTYSLDREMIEEKGSLVSYSFRLMEGESCRASFRHPLYRDWLDPDSMELESESG